MTETKWEKDRGRDLSGGLPTGSWPRILALWSFAPVPFFRAFDCEEETRLARVEDHLRAAEEG